MTRASTGSFCCRPPVQTLLPGGRAGAWVEAQRHFSDFIQEDQYPCEPVQTALFWLISPVKPPFIEQTIRFRSGPSANTGTVDFYQGLSSRLLSLWVARAAVLCRCPFRRRSAQWHRCRLPVLSVAIFFVGFGLANDIIEIVMRLISSLSKLFSSFRRSDNSWTFPGLRSVFSCCFFYSSPVANIQLISCPLKRMKFIEQ